MESTIAFEDLESLNDFLEEAELQQYFGLFRDVLKVTKLSQLKFVLTEDLVHIGLSRPEQRRYKKIYSKYFPNPYMSKIKKMLTSNKKRDQNIHGHSSIPFDPQPVFENNVKVPTKHIISIEDITINKELGMGQFGVVQQGTWTTGNQRLQVAIKCLGHERMTSNSTEFLKEAAVMHSIEHPNIVRLYGVVLHLDSLMLVTELAPLRSLLECLREVSLRLNFPVPNLCEFAEQICDGMTYLESKRLIHRDLAARNILVFNKDRVKISDFGLSRALGVGKDYYQTNYNVNLKLPVAWCAPECILFLRFTSASDVWAFGVCLWEMFTYGFQPWAAFSGQQILEAIDAPNFQRLERPECCPEAYYITMLECWAHDFNNRPKFKDLALKLRSIRPEQVQATVNFQKPEDGRRSNFLEYKTGQIITVLGKENMTKSPLWYGVLPGGACGMFDPAQMKPYIPPEKNVCYVSGSLSPHPIRQSARSIRTSLLRSDVKRHTYTGKRTIQRSMISSPQGDVKHTGHVGLDGAYFGDISFLDPAGCPPRQIVTPYKPSEDLEQVPLINPNSPSHLTGSSGTTPYPMLASNRSETRVECEKVDLPCDNLRGLRKNSHRTLSEPTTSKSILSKVRSATLGRSHKGDNGSVPKTDEVHEYHEISDTETEGTVNSCNRSDRLASKPEHFDVLKSTTDFSQSLLEELECMFRSLDMKRREEPNQPPKQPEPGNRSQTLTKAERKKGSTSTMKPMSAHDEKTLNTAVALANEITSKSMNDLDGDKKPQSPGERSKFHFKFPLSLHHGTHSHETEKDTSAGARERRNFSEEARSVPDLQSTLTEESKMAYTSLIEEPTPSTSLMSHIAKESSNILKPATFPKPARGPSHEFDSLRSNLHLMPRAHAGGELNLEGEQQNILPLPPRNNTTKLVDKPRHIRKYPLKLLDEPKPPAEPLADIQPIIYQNTKNPELKEESKTALDMPSTDSASKVDTNPFHEVDNSSSSNPFSSFETDFEELTDDNGGDSENGSNKALVKDCKDHVSVEDLLEFAGQKPCGRQRGVESDEVRIMNKVLQEERNVLPLPPRTSEFQKPPRPVKPMHLSNFDNVNVGSIHQEINNVALDVVKETPQMANNKFEDTISTTSTIVVSDMIEDAVASTSTGVVSNKIEHAVASTSTGVVSNKIEHAVASTSTGVVSNKIEHAVASTSTGVVSNKIEHAVASTSTGVVSNKIEHAVASTSTGVVSNKIEHTVASTSTGVVSNKIEHAVASTSTGVVSNKIEHAVASTSTGVVSNKIEHAVASTSTGVVSNKIEHAVASTSTGVVSNKIEHAVASTSTGVVSNKIEHTVASTSTGVVSNKIEDAVASTSTGVVSNKIEDAVASTSTGVVSNKIEDAVASTSTGVVSNKIEYAVASTTKFETETFDDDEYDAGRKLPGPDFDSDTGTDTDVDIDFGVLDQLSVEDPRLTYSELTSNCMKVRTLRKILRKEVSTELCIKALEFCEWKVRRAVDLMKIKISVGPNVTLENCFIALKIAHGNSLKAISLFE